MTSPTASPTKRRPLPALVFLLALCLLAALVWWRVLHRDSGTHTASTPTCTTSAAPKTLPEPQAITLAVLNSTKRQGIAGGARTTLLTDGFHVPNVAGNDSAVAGGHGLVPQVAEIRYGPLGASAAKLVLYYFPGAKMVTSKATDATVTVSLGTAYKAVATQTAVTAALKADGISLKPTTGAPDAGSASSTSC
jgi:hypothetical protein